MKLWGVSPTLQGSRESKVMPACHAYGRSFGRIYGILTSYSSPRTRKKRPYAGLFVAAPLFGDSPGFSWLTKLYPMLTREDYTVGVGIKDMQRMRVLAMFLLMWNIPGLVSK